MRSLAVSAMAGILNGGIEVWYLVRTVYMVFGRVTINLLLWQAGDLFESFTLLWQEARTCIDTIEFSKAIVWKDLIPEGFEDTALELMSKVGDIHPREARRLAFSKGLMPHIRHGVLSPPWTCAAAGQEAPEEPA